MTKLIKHPASDKPERKENHPLPFVGQELESPLYGEGLVLFIIHQMHGEKEVGRKAVVRFRNDPPWHFREYSHEAGYSTPKLIA